ncbi:MCE family protein [Haloechinothrix sp. LS1_15]|uniref:MCE family protein n=1 Tax=Haloechinothrix sp. LS1_15 TaxID=2652248 RepID=UPI002947AB5F|nr:MCE family protein [Haloechinothrix sp. LS1_15]MDV6014129.1 MCE family protein [Haloechinothrix sp. LS1_15]
MVGVLHKVGGPRVIALGCVLALLLAGVLVVTQQQRTEFTAYFDRAVGLYEDSSVRVLGIEVGTVTRVHPEGETVRVDLAVDSDVDVPANASAVVVAPSLVSDRYIQLTPVYEGGEKLAAGAEIPSERTAAPAEIDELFERLDTLATDLGPDGVNADGSLSGALDTVAENVDGTGQDLNRTVTKMAELARTFDDSGDDLFDTVDSLADFVTMLARSDEQLDELYDTMADVTGFLAEESGEVDAALHSLAIALDDVRGFVDENSETLSSNVDKLAALTHELVEHRGQVAEVFDVAPTAMSNFINAYDAASGTIAVRGNLNEFTFPPAMMLCRILGPAVPDELPIEVTETCMELAPVIDGALPLPSVSEIVSSLNAGELPSLPLPLENVLSDGRGGE